MVRALHGEPCDEAGGDTPDIAIDASGLPGPIRGDPGDRLIIATARHLGIPIVTRDRRIIAYAEGGFVEAISC